MVTTSCLDCEPTKDKDYILFIPESLVWGSTLGTRLELNVCSIKKEKHSKLTLTRTTGNVDSIAERCHDGQPLASLWSSQQTWWELLLFYESTDAINEEGQRLALQQKLYFWSKTLWSTTGAHFVPGPLSGAWLYHNNTLRQALHHLLTYCNYVTMRERLTSSSLYIPPYPSI